MTEQQRDALRQAGMDVPEALERFMNQEALLMKFVMRFPQDPGYGELRRAMEQGDVRAAFEAAHSLKGVAGNLSLKPLYIQVSLLVEDLRAGSLEQAQAKMASLEQCYGDTIRAIQSL